MTRDELRAQFRLDADDLTVPPLFSDAEADSWLNQAEEEAAIRADLLHEIDDPDLCQVAVVAGTAVYPRDSRLFRVTRAQFTEEGADEPVVLTIIDRIELDRIKPNWRRDEEPPRFIIVEPSRLRLGCLPSVAGLIELEGYRLPVGMAAGTDEPEIPAGLHRHLIHWALHRAYDKPDSETRDPGRAATGLAEFTKIFGARPDADLKQATEARPHVNKAHW